MSRHSLRERFLRDNVFVSLFDDYVRDYLILMSEAFENPGCSRAFES